MQRKKGKKTTKKSKVKALNLKYTEVSAKNAKKVGHFCGRLYHKGDYELRMLRGGTTKFFDKEGSPIKRELELFDRCK